MNDKEQEERLRQQIVLYGRQNERLQKIEENLNNLKKVLNKSIESLEKRVLELNKEGKQ